MSKSVVFKNPSVLPSGPLIHDCNPTTLHVWYVPRLHRFTDRGCNVDPVFSVSYKRHIKWNKAFFLYQMLTFFFLANRPSKEVWKKEKVSNTVCYNRLIVGYTVSTKLTDWFFSLWRGWRWWFQWQWTELKCTEAGTVQLVSGGKGFW